MKKITITVIAILSVFTSFSQVKNFIDQPYIDTTAKVDSLVSPDRIYLNIVLHEEDSKGKKSIEDLEIKMEKVLKKNGVNTKQDLCVLDMKSNYKKYFLKEQDILKSKVYSLLLYNSKTAASVFIALEEAGISNVSLEKTAYSKMEQLEMDMKFKAILKAKKQALVLSNAIGQKVGKAIYIMDRNQRFMNYQRNLEDKNLVGFNKKEAQGKITEVDFEKIKFETTVSVKFILE